MNRSKRTLYLLAGIMTVAVFLLILWKIPQYQASAYLARISPETLAELKAPERVQLEKNAADIETATRLTIAQIIGGLALLSGLYFTYQNVKTAQDNLRVTEQGKLTERFSKAVELLGSDKLDVRLGGIYALERIARDSQKDHWTVMEVLTAFIRENSHKKLHETKKAEKQKYLADDSWNEKQAVKIREDIQVIMTVIGGRKWTETENQKLNLQKVNLTGCFMSEALLCEVDLSGATLFGAVLTAANLSRANLTGTDLSQVNLNGANMFRAFLNGANLNEANLSSAYLSGATVNKVNLSGAKLLKADLSGASLNKSDLSVANLSGANLGGADLRFETNIGFEQILRTKNFESARLSPELAAELKEWQAKQSKLTSGLDKK